MTVFGADTKEEEVIPRRTIVLHKPTWYMVAYNRVIAPRTSTILYLKLTSHLPALPYH